MNASAGDILLLTCVWKVTGTGAANIAPKLLFNGGVVATGNSVIAENNPHSVLSAVVTVPYSGYHTFGVSGTVLSMISYTGNYRFSDLVLSAFIRRR